MSAPLLFAAGLSGLPHLIYHDHRPEQGRKCGKIEQKRNSAGQSHRAPDPLSAKPNHHCNRYHQTDGLTFARKCSVFIIHCGSSPLWHGLFLLSRRELSLAAFGQYLGLSDPIIALDPAFETLKVVINPLNFLCAPA